MRILFLIRSLKYGGAQRQLVALAKGLHQRGHHVVITVFYPGEPLEQDVRAAGIRVCSLDKQGRWDIVPGFLLRLVRNVQQEQPQIVHGYLGGSNVLTIVLKPIFRHMRMVWGVRVSAENFYQYGDLMRRIHFDVERVLARYADLIIAKSHAGLEHAVAHGFPASRSLVIPNGIDTARFHPDPTARERIRAEWRIGPHEHLIGLVARLDPMKDHTTFLHAAAHLQAERQDVRFVCVGDGPPAYRQHLYDLGVRLGLDGRLIWAGSRHDMPAVYNAVDISTSSSSSGEGFANVIGESMACGVRCVVTDVADAARIVGAAGVVVPPADAAALAAGWQRVLDGAIPKSIDPRHRVVEKYRVQRLIDRTETVLERLLATGLPTHMFEQSEQS